MKEEGGKPSASDLVLIENGEAKFSIAYAQAPSKHLYTYEGWDALNAKISDKVRDVSSEMKRGNISLTAKKSDTPCDYCKFKPVCRKKI